MPFQSTVTYFPAPGLEGGWASANVHTSMLNPSNGDPTLSTTSASWVAGATGVIVGRFGFANLSTGQVTSVQPTVAANLQRVGFVHRYHPVVITTYLGQTAMLLYGGQEVDIVDGGDFWCKFLNGGTPGQKVFASTIDGSAIGTAVTGGTVTNGVETRWYLDSPIVTNGDIGKISTRG